MLEYILNKCSYVIGHFNAHFSLYAFLLKNCLLFILKYGNDVRQKANLSDFLEFKIDHKAIETTLDINSAFGPGTANEHTAQWWFKNFCKGDKSFEDEERSSWLAIGSWRQLRAIIEGDPLVTNEKLPKNSTSTILWLFCVWSKLERWKSSINGCLMS